MFSALLPIGLPIIRVFLRILGPGDADLGDIAQDLEDALARKQSTENRRSLSRALESTADLALRRIHALLRAEFAQTEEGAVKAAVAAVKATLQTQLDQSILEEVISADLDPQKLEVELRESGAQFRRRILDTDGEHLYDLLLSEACVTICQLASRFKEFTPSVLARTLQNDRRQLEMLERVQNSLDVLVARSVSRDSAEAAEREFEIAYLRSVARTYDKLEVYGLDLNWTVQGYNLTTAYLNLMGQGRKGSGADIASLLSQSSRLAITGQAGCGKTTILQWLAVNAARRRLPSSLGQLNDVFPLLVRLRRYDGAPPALTQLISDTARTDLTPMPDNWLRSRLSEGRILFLIDGLDEVPKAAQANVVDWINAIASDHPKCSIYVTARPSAQGLVQQLISKPTADDLHSAKPIPIIEVLPMDSDHIARFVAHWHKSVMELQVIDRDPQSEPWETLASRAARRILSSHGHRQLASTPLLCAVLCALFHVRAGDLPDSRIETYEAALDLLLNKREDRRGLSGLTGINLEPKHRRLILQRIAGWMLSNELSEVDIGRLEPRVDQVLKEASVTGSFTGRDILDYLTARSGILRDVGANTVDFVHRTFMEYLGSQQLLDDDQVEQLIINAHKSTWSEAVVLAGAHGISKQRDRLLAGIVQRARDSSDESLRMSLIATCAGLVESMIAVNPDTRANVAALLDEVIPPTSSKMADAVARTGHLMLPALTDAILSASIDRRTADLTLRCLAGIGGPEALAVMARFPPERRLEHLDYLLDIWPAFDASEFLDHVLVDLTPQSTTPILIRQTELLPYVKRLSSKFSVSAEITLPPENFSELLSDVPLVHLSISQASLLDPRPFGDDGVQGKSRISAILASPCLKTATLKDLHDVDPAEPISSESLDRISLHFTGGTVDLTILTGLRNVRSVEIVGARSLRTLDALSALTTLETLHLSNVQSSEAPWRRVETRVRNLNANAIGAEFDIEKLIESCPEMTSLVLEEIAGLVELNCLRYSEALSSVKLTDVEDLERVDTLLDLLPMAQCSLTGVTRIKEVAVVEELVSRGAHVDINGPFELVGGGVFPYRSLSDVRERFIESDDVYDPMLSDDEWIGEEVLGDESEPAEADDLTVYDSFEQYRMWNIGTAGPDLDRSDS